LTQETYSLEINDLKSSASLIKLTVGPATDTTLGGQILKTYAKITGSVDTTGRGAERLYVQVSGLDRLVPVGPGGSFTLADLPEGTFDLRIVASAALTAPVEVENVKAWSGATASVTIPSGWLFTRPVYLNTTPSGANTTENVYQFPLLLRLDAGNFDFTGAKDSGQDVRIAKPDGTPLPFAVESWNSAAKSAVLWVLLDTVYANSTAQCVVLSWGNLNAIGQSNSAAVFDTTGGFTGVWHLDENGAGMSGEYRDATYFGNHGTGGNGVAAQTPSRIAGVIDSAQMFDGSDDFIQAPGTTGLNFTNQMTVSFWFYYDSVQAYNARLISKDMDWDVKIVSGRPQISMGGAYYSADALFRQQAWNHIVVTLTGLAGSPAPLIYLNGRLCGVYESTFPDSFAMASRNPAGDLFFGQLGNGSFYLRGAIDEIRLERIARPAAWIALMYENQRKGGALVGLAP
jgi:biopolymer transport protein ExbB